MQILFFNQSLLLTVDWIKYLGRIICQSVSLSSKSRITFSCHCNPFFPPSPMLICCNTRTPPKSLLSKSSSTKDVHSLSSSSSSSTSGSTDEGASNSVWDFVANLPYYYYYRCPSSPHTAPPLFSHVMTCPLKYDAWTWPKYIDWECGDERRLSLCGRREEIPQSFTLRIKPCSITTSRPDIPSIHLSHTIPSMQHNRVCSISAHPFLTLHCSSQKNRITDHVHWMDGVLVALLALPQQQSQIKAPLSSYTPHSVPRLPQHCLPQSLPQNMRESHIIIHYIGSCYWD